MLVFKSVYVTGADRYEDGCFRKAAVPGKLDEGWRGWRDPIAAFQRTYTTDAHVTQYYIPGDVPSVRLNKGAFRALYGTALEPVFPLLLADVDNPGHAAWEDVQEGAEYVSDVCEDVGASGWYLTRAGYRLIFLLEDAIKASEVRRYIVGLIRYLHAKGVPADPLYDLQRLFRLPKVTREGTLQNYPLGFIRG